MRMPFTGTGGDRRRGGRVRRPLPRGRVAHGRRDGRGARRPLRADALAGAVDFLSIGTNDLSQYTYAADRQVGELAELLDPWQPAVLALIAACGEARRRTGWPVGVCGEAGRPRTGAARARALVRDDPPVR
jgi:hypothetical protein